MDDDARFQLLLRMPLPPDEAWARLWNLERHSAAIPFTTVASSDGGPLRAGAGFVGRTSLGPFHLDDEMVVREWQPVERAVVQKVGRWLRGTITVTLAPTESGTELRWHQTLGARGVPAASARLAAPLVAIGYRASLRRILA